ncbi:hypothetical protein ZWY2020_035854 [Hordeum vulgare]|nr:hypothetical protein ZWY2020_035854 [Hordeum vulgare]
MIPIHYFLGTDKVASDDLDPATQDILDSLWHVMCMTTTREDNPLINPFMDGASGMEALAYGRVLVCIWKGDTTSDVATTASASTSGMPPLPLPHPLLEREGLARDL